MKKILSIAILCALTTVLVHAEPQREKGLSLYMLPDRVAKITNQKGGFAYYDKSNNGKGKIFYTPEEILAYFKSLPSEMQNNGIWIVTTHPDAYSRQEIQSYESLKQACLKSNVILFACRASKLPDGWIEGNLFSIGNSDAIYYSMHTVELGWRYFNQGDLNAALKEFKHAELIEPNFAPAYFGEAYVYSVQEKLKLAIKSYKKSIEKNPTHSDSYANLGLALLHSNKPKEAFPMLEKALEINPKSGGAHFNMAMCCFIMKDYAKSWDHIHIAKELKAKIDPAFLKDLSSKMPEPNEVAQ